MAKNLVLAMYGEPNRKFLYAFDQDDFRVPELKSLGIIKKTGKGISNFNFCKVSFYEDEKGKKYEVFSDRSVRELYTN